MKLILIGPPNAGKGTQAQKLTDYYGIPHISTGNLLRDNIQKQTELGHLAKQYVESGRLVPDELVIKMVSSTIAEIDLEQGFLFDGYPRNIAQAENLDAELEARGTHLDGVILIHVKKQILIERAIGRRVCPTCNATYHILKHPPKVDNQCDICASPLVHRKDDSKKTVKKRIQIYKEQTSPLVEYYTQTDRLYKVRGEGSPEDVFQEIVQILGAKA